MNVNDKKIPVRGKNPRINKSVQQRMTARQSQLGNVKYSI